VTNLLTDADTGWNRTESQYEGYNRQVIRDERSVFVGLSAAVWHNAHDDKWCVLISLEEVDYENKEAAMQRAEMYLRKLKEEYK